MVTDVSKELRSLAEKIGEKVDVVVETNTDLGYSLDLSKHLPSAKNDLTFSIEYHIAPPEDYKIGPTWSAERITLMGGIFEEREEGSFPYSRDWKYNSLAAYFKSLRTSEREALTNLDIAGLNWMIALLEE